MFGIARKQRQTPSPTSAGRAVSDHRPSAATLIALKKALTGVPLMLTCDGACSYRTLLVIDRKLARRLHIHGVVLGSARAVLAKGGRNALTPAFDG
jgi:hypothetical protein